MSGDTVEVLPSASGHYKTMRCFLLQTGLDLSRRCFWPGLVTISNNPSLRKLGLETWKFLQRWAYPAAALASLHGVAFQVLEGRSKPLIALVALMTLTVIALQLKGRQVRMEKSA